MPISNRSDCLRWSRNNGATSRTAVYGPVRTVVWQGSAGDRCPYADQTPLCLAGVSPSRDSALSRSLCAEFGADGVGYGGGVVVHEGFGFGFDHDAGEGFGTGVADDYAAGVGEGEFCGGDGGGDGGDLVERTLFADVHVDDDLREGLEVGGELGEGLAAAVDDVEQQECGEQAVTGGAAAGEDDVAGLFAAQGCAGGEHLFEDVLVADGGAEHCDLRTLECGLEAHVRHSGGDDGGVGEQAAGGEIAGGEQEDRVAVDYGAMLVGEEGAVGVAVEGDAH